MPATRDDWTRPSVQGGSSSKEDGLPDRQAAGPEYLAVDSRVVAVGACACLHHLRGQATSVGIDVHHGAAKVTSRDHDSRCIAGLAERERATHPPTHPFIFVEGDIARGSNLYVRSKSTDIRAGLGELADLPHGSGGDQ